MPLRARLFLLLAALLALLMGAQWWLIRSLARDLDTEVSLMAVTMGRDVVDLVQGLGAPPWPGDEPPAPSGKTLVEVRPEVAGESGFEEPRDEPPEEPLKATVDVHVVRRPEKRGAGEEGAPTRIEERLLTVDEKGTEGGRIVRIVRQIGEEPPVVEEIDLDELTRRAREKAGEPGAEVRVLHAPSLEEAALVLESPRLRSEIPIPLESFDDRLQAFSNRLLWGTLALLALGLALAAAVAHRVSRPLRSLAEAARRVGEGELGQQVPEQAGGEVGETLRAFNHMSSRLAQLEQDAERLRSSRHLSELGEVSRGFAHSLRNPLNALGLSIDTLAEGELPEEERRSLAATARQQIRRVDGALRSFLALAGAGSGSPEGPGDTGGPALEAEPVAVSELLQDVALEALQDCRGRQPGGGDAPRVAVEPAPDLPPLMAVAPELRAVLQALVVNAVEASPPGGRVKLGAEALGDHRIRITVEDEGPGLSPQVRRRLFTPHVTTKAHGSGMGLFLAQRIARSRYGGELRLEDAGPARPGKPGKPGGTRAVLDLGPRQNLSTAGEAREADHG